ncbi:hypothetical protein DEU56DRAFT_270201 [Suillus clintonianus]|uniref:uncharacterized protein n=1 Tax=Suillus clintonianus TaxID=1904413 RepID=UPI001B882D33|nr:uncharacterized protein DEU56DRAFT_270201 [Suillus clintonianus]KAG2141900.1 hypothetical protein DEU56DRAFT_270201 [Suillus clintonianus]
MQTDNPKSDIMAALQKILRSQATVPNLETPYSQATFLNPNHCAIELKEQSLNAIITERQQELDTVLHEISDLQTLMDRLVEKKVKIVESINLHKRLRSALWRLPAEVLSHIFVNCLPEDKYLLPALNLAPILLTRICRRWREVAVGTPSLWCRLRLEVESGDWQKRAFCYESWLKRTIECPLSLALRCDDDWTRVQRLVQPYTAQISSLSIDFWERDTPGVRVLAGCQALEELSVIITDEVFCGALLASIGRAISQLPSTLCNLSVTGWELDPRVISTFNPVWAHLTTVEIHARGSVSALHLLQLAPNLSSLTIRIESHGIQAALESFTHTKLQFLHITCVQYSRTPQLSGLLDALSLPTLRVLYIRSAGGWPHKAFKAFLTRSECRLETLLVGSEGTTADKQRAEYVTLVPSIQYVGPSPW